MKIHLFSPKSPPDRCGVGDYNFFLSQALVAKGFEVETHSRNSPTSSAKLEGVTVVQYTPQLFSSLWSCLKIILRSKGPVVFNFHELYYPPSLGLRGLLIGVPHWIRFVILLHLCDLAIFSTAGFCKRWMRRLPYLEHKMSWIPVGSNIPRSSDSIASQKQNGMNLLHFGGAHPTHLYDFIFEAFQNLLQRFPEQKFVLTLVGAGKEELKEQLSRYSSIEPLIRFLGYLKPVDVSREISGADLVLAPFMDGVTTRRGSVMTALEHGKPVITTFLNEDDFKSLPWSDFLDGVRVDQVDAKVQYAEKVAEWVAAPAEKKENLSQHARIFFLEIFSWQAIATAIENKLKSLNDGSRLSV